MEGMFVSTIDEAMKKIDFEITDSDKVDFYTYVFRHHYKIEFPYDSEEYRPPKYFRILLKEIMPYL